MKLLARLALGDCTTERPKFMANDLVDHVTHKAEFLLSITFDEETKDVIVKVSKNRFGEVGELVLKGMP